MIRSTKLMKKRQPKMLMEDGSKEKEPGMMASAFSKMTTEMKLMMKDDSSQGGKAGHGTDVIWGIQTLGGYINEYKNASGQSMNLARAHCAYRGKFNEGCTEISVTTAGCYL